nr:ATP-binding protein [Kibdelosporangium sp. MJ126-NF4]
MAAQLSMWADHLPPVAAEVVATSDRTRPHVYAHLPAEPGQATVARRQIAQWATRIGLPDVLTQDITLAADEALSNAIEHAYRDSAGTFVLFAACAASSRAARVIVTDHGHWQPPAADPGFRGRGLTMMNRLSDVFHLVHTGNGTTVVLGWTLPAG